MRRYACLLALLALPLVAYSAGGFSVAFSIDLSAEEAKAVAHVLGAPGAPVSQEDVAAYLRNEVRQLLGRRLREYQQFAAANAPVGAVVTVMETASPALKIEPLPEKAAPVMDPVKEPAPVEPKAEPDGY